MDRHRNSMNGLPLPNSWGGGREHGLMLVVSAFEELGVLAVVLGDLLPGEGRLLEDDLLPGPLPKDKMGEESRDRC